MKSLAPTESLSIMGAMKLLLVEDDMDIQEFVRRGFKALSFIVDATGNGKHGSYLARTNEYDVIILDHSLPEQNGIEICEEIREAGSSVPIIFLSIIDNPKKKIEALSKGADDYLAKPFFFEELRERVRALLRRPPHITTPILSVNDLMLDIEKQTVTRAGRTIYLTRKEYTLLEYLMRNNGRAVSRSMILEHVWSAGSDPLSNTVESHILRLRKKVNAEHEEELIKNIPGRGYVMTD